MRLTQMRRLLRCAGAKSQTSWGGEALARPATKRAFRRARWVMGFVAAALLCGVAAVGDEETESSGPNLHRLQISPDGTKVAFMSDRFGEWELFVADLDGGNVRRLTDHVGWDGYELWSPDGKQLLFDRGEGDDIVHKNLHLLDLDTGEVRLLVQCDPWMSSILWAQPERVMGFRERTRGGDRDLVWIDARTGETTTITDTPGVREGDGALSRDERILYFSSSRDGQSRVERLDLATGARERLFDGTGRLYGLALAPDGRRLAYNDIPAGEEDAEIFVYDLLTGTSRRLTDNDAWDHMAVWTHDGAMLMFTSYRSGSEKAYLINPDSGETYPLSFD